MSDRMFWVYTERGAKTPAYRVLAKSEAQAISRAREIADEYKQPRDPRTSTAGWWARDRLPKGMYA